MYDKNLKHLADISPYKIHDIFPFNQWDSDFQNSKIALVVIDLGMTKWLSLKVFQEYVIDRINNFCSKRGEIPFFLDTNENQLKDQLPQLLKNTKNVFILSMNTKFSKRLIKVRDELDFNLHYFWFTSLSSFGLQFKSLGLNLLRTGDSIYTLCQADVDILKPLFSNLEIQKYGLENSQINISSIENPRKNLVYIGRLNHSKNIHTLIKFLAYLNSKNSNSYKLHLFGVEDNFGRGGFKKNREYKTYLKSLSQNLKVEEHLKFYGYIPKEEIFSKLPDDSIGVFLSTYANENYGLAPREMLRHGFPVLVSHWGGFADLKDNIDDACIIESVIPEYDLSFDMQELAEKFVRLAYNTKKRKVILSENILEFTEYNGPKNKISEKNFLETMLKTDCEKERLFFEYYSRKRKN